MSYKKIITIALLISVVAYLGSFAFGVAHAQSWVPSFLTHQYDVGSGGINTLIQNVIQFVFAIAGLVVLGFIVFAGFKFITSGGDAGKKEEAQKQIVAAVIGLLIIVFSFFIVQLVFNLLGIGSVRDIQLPCGNQNQNPGSTATGTQAPCFSATASG